MKVIAAKWLNKIVLILVNYDPDNRLVENVPITITNLAPGNYEVLQKNLTGETALETIPVATTFQKLILMPANSVVSLQISKK